MPLVFQYGSNCLEERLNSPERLNGGARYDGRAQTVDQYEIVFDVWSRGNGCAAADLRAVETREQHVWGVLYQVTDEGFGRLRQVEGPRYEEKSVRVRNLLGEIKHAKTFLVRAREREQALWTSANYVGYIVNGLRNHQVPEEYVQHVIDIAIRTNDDARDQNSAKTQLLFLEALRAQ
jgi:gamma-glutamylcyclotransferase